MADRGHSSGFLSAPTFAVALLCRSILPVSIRFVTAQTLTIPFASCHSSPDNNSPADNIANMKRTIESALKASTSSRVLFKLHWSERVSVYTTWDLHVHVNEPTQTNTHGVKTLLSNGFMPTTLSSTWVVDCHSNPHAPVQVKREGSQRIHCHLQSGPAPIAASIYAPMLC